MIPFRKWFEPQEENPDRDRQFVRMAIAVFAAATLVRAVAAVTLPLDLSGDETYYWDWGRRLSWGYYSKPPGIAWLMAAAGGLTGDTELGIRAFAVVIGAATAWGVYLFTRQLYSAQAAFLALVAFVCTPATAAMNFVLSIDVPLVFCWTAALMLLWRYVQAPKTATAVGLALALVAGALSKQMMLVFPLIAIAFAALTPDARHVLRRPAFWIVMISPVLGMVPPVWWNYRHDWITFKHTSHHFNQDTTTLAGALSDFAGFVASEAAILTPIGYALLLAVVVSAAARWPRLGARERYLVLFCATGLAATLAMTVRQRVNANWPAVFYVSGLVLLAGWVTRAWGDGRRAEALRRAAAPGLALAILFTIGAYALAFAIAYRAVDLGRLDPAARVHGWSELAVRVHEVRSDLPRPADTFILALGHRYFASELAFYLPDHPRVFSGVPVPPGTIRHQYDLWPSPQSRIGDDALIVYSTEDGDEIVDVRHNFDSVEHLAHIEVPNAYSKLATVEVYLGRNLTQWRPPDDE